MKLNSAQLERTLGQFEARPIPDDHPLIPQLNDLFGEHTFFLDRRGLNIVEPVEAAGVSGRVVNLASWSDDSESGLEVHEAEATDVVITLELRHWFRSSTMLSANRWMVFDEILSTKKYKVAVDKLRDKARE
jgi:hypothetical protein